MSMWCDSIASMAWSAPGALDIPGMLDISWPCPHPSPVSRHALRQMAIR
ncbi:MAG TPA: hypothetical protein VGR48_07400 [Terriglobales bacterium]|nr:hypothetical protein [Terriglobales bacterium]